MANEVPYNMIVGEARIYIGPVGESYPAIDLATPAGGWVDLGFTDGDAVINHAHTRNAIRHNQSAMPQKEVLVSADLTVTFNLAEADLEAYGKILEDQTVTEVAAGSGTAGYKSIPMAPASTPQFSLLVRVPSSIADGFRQYQIDRGNLSTDNSLTYSRSALASIPCEFHAVESIGTPGQFGTIVDFAATALP